MKRIRILLILLFCVECALHAQISVIVHKSNPVKNYSMEELKQVYRGDISLHETGRPIVLVEAKPISEEFYQLLYNKSHFKIKKYWISLVFSGRSANPPTEKANSKDVLAFVSSTPGAIAFIPASDMDDTVKIVTVNKLSYKQSAYPLQTK